MRESTGRLAKLKRYVHIICGILDIIAAALVLVGILLNIGSIVGNLGTFEKLFTDTSEFKHYLEKRGINVTIRREMGRDIGGACGQLRKSFLEQEKEG